LLNVASTFGLLTAGCGANGPVSPDEASIRATVQEWQEASNRNDFEAWSALTCEADLKSVDRSVWGSNGPGEMTVNSVHVDGDKATISVTQTFTKGGGGTVDDVGFVREDGKWKWCQ
jgi:hypothetical protein